MHQSKYPIFLAKAGALTAVFVGVFLFASSALALTISPAKIEATGNPGTTINLQFKLINEESSSKTYYLDAENFQAEGETGAPHFTTGTEDLASWMRFPNTITLQKGEEKNISFDVAIPSNAEAGGHFAALFLSSQAPTNGDQVSVGSKIGVLVLLRVSGNVKEGGGILSFMSSSGSKLFASLPISFTYRFQNSGGDRVQPKGTVEIKNILGWGVDTIDANGSQGNILPQSIRKFDIVWGGAETPAGGFFAKVWFELSHFAFGIYKANLHIGYGDKGSVSEASNIVFVIPWQLIITLLVVGVFVWLIFSTILRKYNRWIITKAQGL